MPGPDASQTPPVTAQPPTWLALHGWEQRFQVMEKIGAGGTGQVWRATEAETGRVVALKILAPHAIGDEQLLARMEIEANTLLKVRDAGQHPNVVPVIDFHITESQACLVTEFIPGMDLLRWTTAQNSPLEDCVQLIAKAADAAGWFHALGIVHRDLKPANILVSAITHEPVIVDFSIAKLDDTISLTLTNEALGTGPYMAPEQFDSSRGAIAPATDVYALGATLYELLTQVRPHPGSYAQIIQRHTDEVRPARPSALNPAIPRDLECILLKALSHRPEDRYPDGRALAQDLEFYLADRPVTARPISRLTHLVRQARKKPALTGVTSACIVFAAFSLWNVWKQTATESRFELEAAIADAIGHRTWTAETLSAANTTLAALTKVDPVQSSQWRQKMHDDIIRDVESALQQSHLAEAEFQWMQDAIKWLRVLSPAQAQRLDDLREKRLGRWETLAELKPPFANTAGLFPGVPMTVANDLLFPQLDQATKSQTFVITETAPVPVELEVAVTVQNQEEFQYFSMTIAHGNLLTSLLLKRARQLARGVRELLSETPPKPDDFVLHLTQNHVVTHAIVIDEPSLLDHTISINLRIEQDHAEADIDGRWQIDGSAPFALGTVEARNACRITLDPHVGISRLQLRTRRDDSTSPLQQADLLAAQERWPSALRLYEAMRGDPAYGTEAEFKIAECLQRQDKLDEAFAIWQKMIAAAPSMWRDRAMLKLWILNVTKKHSLRAAAPYLAHLPDPAPLELLKQIDSRFFRSVADSYASAGMGIALPRVDVDEILGGIKAYHLLQKDPVQTANRFALALHSAHRDRASQDLYSAGLANLDRSAKYPDTLLAAINCLDQWCRIVPSEMEPKLTDRLNNWQKTMRKEPTVQTIWHMEQARKAARAADAHTAIIEMESTELLAGADNRVQTSAWLLKGMLFRLQGNESRAQKAWAKAIEIAKTVTLKSPLHLCDRIMLHCLTQTWGPLSADQALVPLAYRHLVGDDRNAAEGQFINSFLADPSYLKSLNGTLQSDLGRELAEDYCLCKAPPRDLVQRFYRLMFEHYFLQSGFAQPPSPEQLARVRDTVQQLMVEMTSPHANADDLFSYIRAWSGPSAGQGLFDNKGNYTPELIENLRWLYEQRRGRSETAR